jgi:hypothetical protein
MPNIEHRTLNIEEGILSFLWGRWGRIFQRVEGLDVERSMFDVHFFSVSIKFRVYKEDKKCVSYVLVKPARNVPAY